MEVSRELLFFFSALGAFNGLLLGCYFLFFTRPQTLQNRFLGGLLIALSVRTGKSVFYYFNSDLAGIYLQLGLTACFFIGPFLYFYIKSNRAPLSNIHNEWIYHVTILLSLSIGVGIMFPFESHTDLWRPYIIQFIYKSWLIYILLAGYYLLGIFRLLVRGKLKFLSQETWILSIYFGNFIIWLSYNTCAFGSYIVGALSFTFMLYIFLLFMIFRKKRVPIKDDHQSKYENKKITSKDAEVILSQLDTIMKDKMLYKTSTVKLSDIARELDILPHKLSQILNDNHGKNFSAYINEYRIDAAKTMLITNKTFSLEGIGYDCGFNSKSTFYSVFKKITGVTPAQFRERELQIPASGPSL